MIVVVIQEEKLHVATFKENFLCPAAAVLHIKVVLVLPREFFKSEEKGPSVAEFYAKTN